MGREIRKVPKGWQHPKDGNGKDKPLYDEYYGDAIAEWIEGHNLWLQGKHTDQMGEDPPQYKFFAEWNGNPPDIEHYRTEKWTEEEASCFQMYQNVSEGTPVSPVFETLQELEDWLVEKGHSRHAAQSFCKTGYAPSMVIGMGMIKQGVDVYDIPINRANPY